jgi:hypothetical protein
VQTPLEVHYSVQQIADAWQVSIDLVRDIFSKEEGVLRLSTDRGVRGYVTLRIPESVLARVHQRRSSAPAIPMARRKLPLRKAS